MIVCALYPKLISGEGVLLLGLKALKTSMYVMRYSTTGMFQKKLRPVLVIVIFFIL